MSQPTPAFDPRNAANAMLAAIVESSDDAIVSKTLDGIITTWNLGAQRIFGYTPEEAIGRSITILIPDDRLHEEPGILARIRSGLRVDHYETIRKTKNGRLIDVSVTISPIKNAAGEIIGASKIARDITAARALQRELLAAKEEAENANRAKDQFLSVLSHELRTPLTPALFGLSMLEERTDLPSEVREEIGMARRNVETEARLVDDLLDLTRVSRSKLKLRLEVVDVHRTVRTVLQMVQRDMDQKHIDLSLSLRAKQHHTWADPGRLQQIFLNLLSNAVKFTPENSAVTIRAWNPQADRIAIEITDTGIGIEADLLPRLFKPFEQAPTSSRFGGLGLGLSIARSLAELHGGSLGARSEGKDKGSTFTLNFGTVPAPEQSDESHSHASESRKHVTRVLLVEDHNDTRLVVTRLLARLGCKVTAASSVKEALPLVDLHSFDLLISDIGLPDGTGLDVMRYARSQPQLKGIALSGFGHDEDVRRSEEAGFTVHLTKPINFRLLEETIQKLAVPA